MNRDKIVMVRLNPDEHAAWQAAAEADQRKLADFVRVVMNAAIAKRKPAKVKRAKR